jgi:hypothetical protein
MTLRKSAPHKTPRWIAPVLDLTFGVGLMATDILG